MAARPEPQSPGAAARPATSRAGRRPAKLSRDSIVNAALTFLDREGWDALTINALATQLGTKGPSLYNHVDSLRRPAPHGADAGRRRHHRDAQHRRPGPHPRRRGDGDGQRLPQLRPPPSRAVFGVHPDAAGGGDDPEFTDATRAAAGPVIAVLASYGLDGEDAFYAALEFWSAMHGFVLLEMTGVMGGIVDTDTVFTDMVMRLAAGMQRR